MKNKLILVEGLPGSGKSTTAKHIATYLTDRAIPVLCVDEGTGEHPADYEYHSYLTKADMAPFDAAERDQLLQVAITRTGGYIIPLAKLQGDLLHRVSQYKVYDCLPWEKEKQVMLDGWREFVQHADSNLTYIFNCCFLQNPMCETMIRFDLPEETSLQYVRSLSQILMPMKPLVVYLKESNAHKILQQAAVQRNADWLNDVIAYHCNGKYGKAKELNGFDGYVACLTERQRRELSILQQIECSKLVLQNPSKDWEKAYTRLDRQLSS